MKRILSFALTAALFVLSLAVPVSADTALYSLDGRTAYVNDADVAAWLSVGWYSEPVMSVYSLDGRELVIPRSQLAAYENVGWYAPITMYAPDGRTLSIPISQLEAYERVGWYREVPTTTLYAADGRTICVKTTDVPAYLTVGWYETYSQARSSVSANNDVVTDQSAVPAYGADVGYVNNVGTTVTVTRTGEKYHRSTYQYVKNKTDTRTISLDTARIKGYTACKVCKP